MGSGCWVVDFSAQMCIDRFGLNILRYKLERLRVLGARRCRQDGLAQWASSGWYGSFLIPCVVISPLCQYVWSWIDVLAGNGLKLRAGCRCAPIDGAIV